MDRSTLHALGTLSIAGGAALLILSLPVVAVGAIELAESASGSGASFAALADLVPVVDATRSGPKRTLSLGLLGLGVGAWFLGAGLLAQGRAERK